MSAIPDSVPRPIGLHWLFGLGLGHCGFFSPYGVRIHGIQGAGHQAPIARARDTGLARSASPAPGYTILPLRGKHEIP
jgi:hypothetical protein